MLKKIPKNSQSKKNRKKIFDISVVVMRLGCKIRGVNIKKEKELVAFVGVMVGCELRDFVYDMGIFVFISTRGT